MNDKYPMNIVPYPQKLKFSVGGTFVFSEAVRIFCDESSLRDVLDELCGELREISVRSEESCKEGAQIIIKIEDIPFRADAYTLRVDSAKIIIAAAGARGLFYGVQTLKQIIRDRGREIPAMEIEDHPDIAIRYMLVDLRFQTFRMEYLIEKIKTWAELKVNGICIEYSDKFPYSGMLEVIRDSDAFSVEEIKQLVAFCKSHFMEIIPLTQSFGHMEYVLKNERFSSINENRANGSFHSQCCPMLKESMDLLKEVIRQSYELHERPRIFCIGGDEAMYLGECPLCSEYIAKHGKGWLYLSHINGLIEYVNGLGATPLLYADMLLAYPEVLENLDRRCILGDWDYWTHDEKPQMLLDWSSKKNITAQSKNVDSFSPFAYSRMLKEKQFSVLLHPSTHSVGPSDHFTPNYHVHLKNISACAKAAKSYALTGAINTAWERYLMETITPGVAYFAECCWSGADVETFGRRFAKYFFGVDGEEIMEAMFKLSYPYTLVEKKWPRVYILEAHGRGEISPEDILHNEELRENIYHGAEVFEKNIDVVKRNAYALKQWLFGAEIKKFYMNVLSTQTNGGDASGLDAQASCLKERFMELLKENMPLRSIEQRFEKVLKTKG